MQIELLSSEVRRRFASLIDLALMGREIIVKRDKNKVAVLVSYEQYENMKAKAALLDCESTDEQISILMRRLGDRLESEAAASGGVLSGDEFLAWSEELRGKEFVATALEGQAANAVVG